MAEPLKNMYNQKFFDNFLEALSCLIPKLDQKLFLERIYEQDWEQKELKQRIRHIATTLRTFLPQPYEEAIAILLKLNADLMRSHEGMSFEYIFIPDFIEQYGLDDLPTSLHAMEEVTQFTSCEYAIRPYLIKYPTEVMDQMQTWSKHEHPNVRRFSSEGCRPRLPWAMAIPKLKKDPSKIIPILENLMNDPSEFVRKSVANNLNDISKDHPNLIKQFLSKWMGTSEFVDKILKHGCRTMLKEGDREVMDLFGLINSPHITMESIKIVNPKVEFGDYLHFEFQLVNIDSKPMKVRLEYAIYYQKANGTLSKKVYKISEKNYEPHSKTIIHRRQPFKPITTRKFHPGLHQLSIIINGIEYSKNDFHLVI